MSACKGAAILWYSKIGQQRDAHAAMDLSSARPSRECGIVRPSVFAVLRSMISSIFVCCWTNCSTHATLACYPRPMNERMWLGSIVAS